jgi:hypothetical protein
MQIEHILGEVPFFAIEDAQVDTLSVERNPALRYLQKQLHEQSLVLHSERTLAKVARVLFSQRVTATTDHPTRFLWMSNINTSEGHVTELIREALVKHSGGGLTLKGLAYRYYPQAQSSVAVATFATPEAAITALLHLVYHPLMKGTAFAFGKTGHPAELQTPAVAAMVQVSGPHPLDEDLADAEINYATAFMALSTDAPSVVTLTALLTAAGPTRCTLNTRDAMLEQRGPWSLSIINSANKHIWLLKMPSSEWATHWYVGVWAGQGDLTRRFDCGLTGFMSVSCG